MVGRASRDVRVTGYDEPATGHQLHTIAVLCQACGISECVEDQHMTIGQAGILIRRLKGERRVRQDTVRTGNPTCKT